MKGNKWRWLKGNFSWWDLIPYLIFWIIGMTLLIMGSCGDE